MIEPYFEEEGTKLYKGSCLDVLPQLPQASVQCVVTSPPYWGLRDYGIAPQVWDAAEGCAHVWGHEVVRQTQPQRDNHGGLANTDTTRRGTQSWTQGASMEASQGAFCQHCPAWRGSLGLEPTMALYVAHIVQVFAEVWRVLRDDGTLWLNLGDSYSSQLFTRQGKPRNIPQAPNDWHGTDLGGRQRVNHVSMVERHELPGLKPKDLCGIPWRVAFALQDAGWYLRSDIIWQKPSPMPESVTDRPTKSHEYLFLLTKRERYYYDSDAIREPHAEVSLLRAKRNRFGGKYLGSDPAEHGAIKSGKGYGPNGDHETICSPGGRNRRTVWTIATQPYADAHFATFPPKLVEPCILAGSKIDDVVLDPFAGAGTTLLVAKEFDRQDIGIELNQDYCDMAIKRVQSAIKRLRQGVLDI